MEVRQEPEVERLYAEAETKVHEDQKDPDVSCGSNRGAGIDHSPEPTTRSREERQSGGIAGGTRADLVLGYRQD